MPGGERGVYPQPVTDDIGFRYRLQRFVVAQVHIAAGNQRMQGVRRFAHDFFIQRKLERKQVLRQLLSACPAEDRDGRQDFPGWRITGQTPALTAGMEDDSFFCG